MKKILFILVALILTLAIIPAFAEAIPEPAEEIEVVQDPTVAPAAAVQQPFTWEYLATIAGATAAVLLIVQFLKFPLDKVWKIPTRILVYAIALIIVLLATYFTAGLTVENGVMCALNAFMVSVSAYGAYEITFAKFIK